jgi:GrpB-like predicted nucleotidyltransferase (UPF0157 family)
LRPLIQDYARLSDLGQDRYPCQYWYVEEGSLGLGQGVVFLAPHDPSWPVFGERERSAVNTLLGSLALDVEHVGSTAIADLEAKPILDIAVALDPLNRETEEIVRRMEAGGYKYRGDHGPDGGLLFVRAVEGVRRVHVHMVPIDDPEWTAYLDFRDYLRANSARRDEYQQLKRQLAERYPNDREAYTDAKSAFVRDTLRLARDAPGTS